MDVHQMTKDPYLCPPQTKHQKQQALQQQAQQMAQQQPTAGSSGAGQQLTNFGGGGSLSGEFYSNIIIRNNLQTTATPNYFNTNHRSL